MGSQPFLSTGMKGVLSNAKYVDLLRTVLRLQAMGLLFESRRSQTKFGTDIESPARSSPIVRHFSPIYFVGAQFLGSN